jgi:hypothetical protein
MNHLCFYVDVICVMQLDIITRTMTILDQRLTQTEDRLSTVLAHSRNLVSVPPQTASSHYPVSSHNPYFTSTNNQEEILRGNGNMDYSYREEDNDDEDNDDENDWSSNQQQQNEHNTDISQNDYSEEDENDENDDEYSYGED